MNLLKELYLPQKQERSSQARPEEREASMFGAIYGDIIGSRFEFDRGGKTTEFELFTKEDDFTDDTVMTIAVADALLSIVINPFNQFISIQKDLIKAALDHYRMISNGKSE